MSYVQCGDRIALERSGMARRKVQAPQIVQSFQTDEEEVPLRN